MEKLILNVLNSVDLDDITYFISELSHYSTYYSVNNEILILDNHIFQKAFEKLIDFFLLWKIISKMIL